MTGVALATSSVQRRYRAGSVHEIVAVDRITLAIDPGSFVALIGPSGSGKSTLLALLGALDRPTAGGVRFGDRDLAGCSDVELARVRRRMGFVFQSESLIPRLPAWENVSYPLVARGVGVSRRRELAESLLDRLGLASRSAAFPEELSGGEQQRVAVARALVGSPEVVFADEPTSQLDTESADRTSELLREIHVEGTTLVVATHDPALIESATRVIALENGRVVDDRVET